MREIQTHLDQWMKVDEKNQEKIRENALRNVALFALFMLKTREYNRLSQTAMKSVMDERSHLVDMAVKHFQSQVERCVSQVGIEVDGIEGLREILEEKPVTVEAMATIKFLVCAQIPPRLFTFCCKSSLF